MGVIDRKFFWNLSTAVHVLVVHEGLMTLLCIMRSPEGLSGQSKFRKVTI